MNDRNSSGEDPFAHLPDQSEFGFGRYRQASDEERTQAFRHLLQQLGPDRARMWGRWAVQISRQLSQEDSSTSPPPGLAPPPEPPSTLATDLAHLRNKVARDVLVTWAQLGRVVLEEVPPRN